MRHISTPKRSLVIAVAAAASLTASLSACSKTVGVDLTLVEPCDQKNQALNGVSSFSVSTEGSVTNDSVVFSVDQGPKPVAVGLGPQVTVTVQAFADDVSGAGAAGAPPQAIGRTVPLAITEASQDFKAVVTMGQLDSFGKTTAADGTCTTMTADAAVRGRHGHTATWVPLLNKVLIVGGAVWGADGSEDFLATAELFDPSTGAFEALPDIGGTRAYHAASALPDGRVLITGGLGVISQNVSALQTGILFDPTVLASPFTTFQMKQPRAHHTSTLMEAAGIVVIAGGCVGQTAADGCSSTGASAGNRGASTTLATQIETFDITQSTNAATTIAIPQASGLQTGRAFHQATTLGDGTAAILVVTGGANANGPACDIEVFRASAGTITRVADAALASFPAGKCPVRHQAVALDGTRLAIIGGQTSAPNGETAPGGTPVPGSPDVFFFSTATGVDPTPAAQLFQGAGRAGHLAALLADGSILVAGGITPAGAPAAEVLRSGVGAVPLTAQPLAGTPLGSARDFAAMTQIAGTDEFLYTGGYTTTAPFTTSAAAELYFGPTAPAAAAQ